MSEQGRPGRYNRSVGGLVGSMVVIVVLIVAFVGFRHLVSNDAATTQQPIDYLQTVQQLQRENVDPIYPATLPSGWTAFNVDYVASATGQPPQFGLSLHTPEQHFVGYEQSRQDVTQLLSTYVDDDAKQADPLSTPGALASTWQGWSDSDGDHAFTATVGEDTVIVYGSAPLDDLETVVRSLSTARLGAPYRSGQPGSGGDVSLPPSETPSPR